MKQHPLRSQPQQLLLNLIKATPSRHNHNLQPGPLQIPINPVFLKRIEREVRRFEHGGFVSVCEATREAFGVVWAGAEEDGTLPLAEFEGDGVDYGGRRGGGEVEDDLWKGSTRRRGQGEQRVGGKRTERTL
jgi:hypothetical protein